MKVPTGGKVRDRLPSGIRRLGETPGPTVTVWMEEDEYGKAVRFLRTLLLLAIADLIGLFGADQSRGYL